MFLGGFFFFIFITIRSNMFCSRLSGYLRSNLYSLYWLLNRRGVLIGVVFIIFLDCWFLDWLSNFLWLLLSNWLLSDLGSWLHGMLFLRLFLFIIFFFDVFGNWFSLDFLGLSFCCYCRNCLGFGNGFLYNSRNLIVGVFLLRFNLLSSLLSYWGNFLWYSFLNGFRGNLGSWLRGCRFFIRVFLFHGLDDGCLLDLLRWCLALYRLCFDGDRCFLGRSRCIIRFFLAIFRRWCSFPWFLSNLFARSDNCLLHGSLDYGFAIRNFR